MSHLDRRTFLTATAAVAAVASTGLHPSSAHAAATVNLEKALLAAQLDPVKDGTGLTPGAAASVRQIEQALVATGHLDAKYVDGHFGTATRTAYTAWQKSLGYSGLGANGLPGQASLRALGKGRFTVTRPVSLGARTTFDGHPFTKRTVSMLREAFRLAGVTPKVEQGSYSPGEDPTSKGTHDGGGAVDLDAEALTSKQATKVVRSLRQVGFAAWLRTPDQGKWPLHIHGIAVNDPDQHVTAQTQVGRYYQGRNGLKNNRPDDGPKVTKVTWEEYLRTSRTP